MTAPRDPPEETSHTQPARAGSTAPVDDRRFAVTLADLHRSLDVQATAGTLLRALVPAHAGWAAIALADEFGHRRFIAARDEARESAHADHPRSGRVDDTALSFAGGAAEIVPLEAGATVVGRLHVGGRRGDPEAFTSVVQHGAVALGNAILYERERRIATTFQNAALVSDLPRHARYRFDAVYETGRADELVGGDWYDAFALDDGRIVLSIGDVVGSGLRAAVAMVNVRQSIRGVAQVHPNPVLMLEAADRTLRTQHPDRYVTAFVGVLDPVTQRCTYANAGHPRPIVRLADGSLERTLGGGIPLGLAFDEERTIREVVFPPGAVFVLYTDGLTEATRDVVDGESRLEHAAQELSPDAPRPARVLHDGLLRDPGRDDVAILTVVAEPGAAVRRWRFDPRWADLGTRVRDELRDELRRHGFYGEALTEVEVVLSELLGNAIRYAPGTVELLLETQAHVAMHLLDRGPGFQFNPRLPNDLYSEYGRGLFLIGAFSKAYVVEHRAGGGSHSRVEFSHPDPGARP